MWRGCDTDARKEEARRAGNRRSSNRTKQTVFSRFLFVQGWKLVAQMCQLGYIPGIVSLNKVVPMLRREGTAVEVVGLNEASATMVDKFPVHDKDGGGDMLMGTEGERP